MKKRELVVLKITLLMIMLLLPTTSAYFVNSNIESKMSEILEKGVGFISPVFEKIIGEYSTSEFFFSKVLLLILLTLILEKVLEKIPITEGNRRLSIIISILISIISIRFINENGLIESILIQYGTLSTAILVIIPLLIFFYFIHHTQLGSYGRRIFWIIYSVIMIVLWASKASEMNQISNTIYIVMIAAIILLLLFDKTIHSYFGMAGFKHFEKNQNRQIIRELKNELIRLDDYLKKKIITYTEYKKEVAEIETKIKELSKE